MIALKIIILVAVAFFWFAILKALRQRGGFWAQWPLSSELTGKFSNLVDLSFIGLGIAIALTPFAFGYGLRTGVGIIPDLLLFAAAAGTIGAMLSRRVWPDETVHLTCSGFAFGGAGIGFAALSAAMGQYLLMGLALAAVLPAAVTLAANLKPLSKWIAKFSRVEWLTAALLLAWLIIAVLWLP